MVYSTSCSIITFDQHVTVSDVLNSDHLLIIFHTVDHVRFRHLLNCIEQFTEWGQFQNPASELIYSQIQINSGEEAVKVAHDFIACHLGIQAVI
jgi:hypothetical protein